MVISAAWAQVRHRLVLKALQEIKSSGGAVRTLGGILSEERRVTIPGLESSHVILIINKIKHTPASYPRKAGTPAKEPLK